MAQEVNIWFDAEGDFLEIRKVIRHKGLSQKTCAQIVCAKLPPRELPDFYAVFGHGVEPQRG